MAALPGLHLRGGVYQLRTTIPIALRARFGRDCIRKSLKTSDRAEAELMGSIERARMLALFASARQGDAGQDPKPQFTQALQKVLEPLQGIALPVAAQSHETQAIAALRETPNTAANNQGKATLAATPENASHADAALFARSPTLMDIYARWRKSGQRSQDTQDACLRAVKLCEQCLGQLPIQKLTRAHGDTFRAWLLEQGGSDKTAHDRFTWVKSLLVYAFRTLEVLTKQPWEGLDIHVTKTQTRRAWRDEELQQLFSQPLFTRYALPTVQKAGADAAYWVPLLGLYTGARISELAQLRIQDIYADGAQTLLTITDSGEGQQLKASASKRTIPLHPELIRLGLLEYIQSIKAAGHESLWPMLHLKEGKPGKYLSNWFGEFRKSIGLTDRYPDFHSFRHLVRTKMSKAKVPDKVQDAITGHETQGSVGTKVYQGVDMDDLVQAIQTLSYGAVSLPRVYASPCGDSTQRGTGRLEGS